jgi:murein DD-endopeptidase MepM/ murein hydrolase activator NlpD
MKKRYKLFYYSEETVSYVEAKGFKLKFAGLVFVWVVAGLTVLFVANHFLGDVLGIDMDRITFLSTENRMLKYQLSETNGRLQDLAAMMDKLVERDNELRLAVNLPKVDEDMRALGTGGTAAPLDVGTISRNASVLINTSKSLVEKMEREVDFQKASYEEVYNQSRDNKILFSHIPAIIPMEGFFSYHSYGMRMHPILGRIIMHEGVDIANDVGTPVHATGDGVVEFAGKTGGNYGIAVEINHGFGYRTWYAHLSRPVVHPGQKVKRGDVIAYSGNTGLSTGPHLHYEVRVNGKQVNPVTYFLNDDHYNQIREQLVLSTK